MSTAEKRFEGLAGDFYGWLAAGELRVQHCGACGSPRHVPRHLCPRCGSADADWMACTGSGQVYSWTTTYRVLHPEFSSVPFTTGVIALDEGPRLVAPLLDIPEPALRIGLPVRLEIQNRPGSPALPAFRPVDPIAPRITDPNQKG